MNHSPILFGYPNHVGRPLLLSQAKGFSQLRTDNQSYSQRVQLPISRLVQYSAITTFVTFGVVKSLLFGFQMVGLSSSIK